MILLDLNLPKKNGHEVLREIREDRRLRTIPVIVLTGSVAVADVSHAYESGANCYVQKQSNLDEYFSLIYDLINFWGKWVRLPRV